MIIKTDKTSNLGLPFTEQNRTVLSIGFGIVSPRCFMLLRNPPRCLVLHIGSRERSHAALSVYFTFLIFVITFAFYCVNGTRNSGQILPCGEVKKFFTWQMHDKIKVTFSHVGPCIV